MEKEGLVDLRDNQCSLLVVKKKKQEKTAKKFSFYIIIFFYQDLILFLQNYLSAWITILYFSVWSEFISRKKQLEDVVLLVKKSPSNHVLSSYPINNSNFPNYYRERISLEALFSFFSKLVKEVPEIVSS